MKLDITKPIWIAFKCGNNKVLVVSNSYDEANEKGYKKLKKKETFYLREFILRSRLRTLHARLTAVRAMIE